MAIYRDEVLINKVIAKLDKLREEKGLTMQELYNDTNVHFARIKSEKRDISISNLKVLCKYFDLTLSEFLKGM